MELEIKVMRCKGLTAFNFFQKLTIYACVSITSEDQRIELTQQQKQEQKTPVDEQGDGDPEWNHTITFDLRLLDSVGPSFGNLLVVFEVRHQGQLFGDKNVGEVRVPLSTLADSVGIDAVRFVSYEVRSPEGKHNGVLDFSYKLVGKQHPLQHHHHHHSEIHISGYHHHHHHNHSFDHHNHIHSYSTSSDVHQNYTLDQSSSSDPEKIQYPKIDLGNWGADNYPTGNVNTKIDLGNWGADNHPTGNVDTTADQFHYYPPVPPPVPYPPPPQHQWGQQPHFPPPPPPPVVYPLPPDGNPHWGYYRPPEYNPPNGGYDGYRRW